MTEKIELTGIFAPSKDIVAREIEGEVIIVPIAAGIGDMEDELYTLNETGRAVWKKLDGKASLETVIASLRSEFEGSTGEIEKDVLGLVGELVERRMLVEIKPE